VLFAVLLVPAGVVGYVIAHSERQKTKTVIENAGDGREALTIPRRSSRRATSLQPRVTTGSRTALRSRTSATVARRDQRLNVSQLKGVWLTHLRKSASPRSTRESQALETRA